MLSRSAWMLIAPRLAGSLLLVIGVLGSEVASAAEPGASDRAKIDFTDQIKPILSDRCYACHGPDANDREAGLRLDTPEGAFAALEFGEGSHVIKPGDPAASEVYLRITSDDDFTRMPPPESKLALTNTEKDLIRRWIEQGAEWEAHWSFQPIVRPELPAVQHPDWVRNPIDRFVLARLEDEGLPPAPAADKATLLRRVTFDLTGLPPTPEELDAFLADDTPEAYERVVDRLLASPRYGERMAVDWLDLARYADTYGYQADVYRAMWPWRDWVIRAFNENMPYDEFITNQLAGDLLPNPTQDQVLATAFNRHHRQTNEGGSIEEEFRAEYVADRVNTLGAAFLGLTLECSRCHDHKYDPITQREYYQFFAYFNSIDESGLYSHFTNAVPTPTLLLTNEGQAQRIKQLEAEIAAAEEKLKQLPAERREAFENWLTTAEKQAAVPDLVGDYSLDAIEGGKVANRANAEQPGNTSDGPKAVPGKVGQGLKLSGENNLSFNIGGNFTRNDPFSIALWMNTPDRKERAVVFHRSRAWTDAGSRGYELLIEDGRLSASLIHFWPGNAIGIRTKAEIPVGEWLHVAMTYDGSSRAEGLKLYLNGQLADCEVVRDQLTKNITGGGANQLVIGQRFRDKGFKNGLVDEFQIITRDLTPLEVGHLYNGEPLAAALAKPAEQRSPGETEDLFAYYLANFDEPYRNHLAQLKSLRQQRSSAVDGVTEIMVMKEMERPRPTYLLQRGAYDAPGEPVVRDVPASLPPLPKDAPRDRLGLAQWLTNPEHPLTARVAVNRFWQQCFGRGLVGTPEDFGSQGELPSHALLMDWLSREFIESGWDAKALLKTIVTSNTYRQASVCPPELRARDPENRLLARGPSYRLPAEMIRDNALFAGGLLVEKQGGPPVKPYQPDGIWRAVSGATYRRDGGEGSHRRSLYTFWKRTAPPPAMMTFDAAKRDVCVVKRQTTATPLQALVLLNDPQYVEAARGLAARSMTSGGPSLEERLNYLFRWLTSRSPEGPELNVLKGLYEEQLAEFEADPEAAAKFLAIGDHKPAASLNQNELAALTVVAKALLSYDQTVRKR